jgi:hypothetical protein
MMNLRASLFSFGKRKFPRHFKCFHNKTENRNPRFPARAAVNFKINSRLYFKQFTPQNFYAVVSLRLVVVVFRTKTSKIFCNVDDCRDRCTIYYKQQIGQTTHDVARHYKVTTHYSSFLSSITLILAIATTISHRRRYSNSSFTFVFLCPS